MDFKHLLLGAVEAVTWYFFFWFLLDAIKKDRNLWIAAFVLLALFYLAFITCPWIRETDAWKRV